MYCDRIVQIPSQQRCPLAATVTEGNGCWSRSCSRSQGQGKRVSIFLLLSFLPCEVYHHLSCFSLLTHMLSLSLPLSLSPSLSLSLFSLGHCCWRRAECIQGAEGSCRSHPPIPNCPTTPLPADIELHCWRKGFNHRLPHSYGHNIGHGWMVTGIAPILCIVLNACCEMSCHPTLRCLAWDDRNPFPLCPCPQFREGCIA